MHPKAWLTVVILIILIIIAADVVLRADISALPEPGRLESSLAANVRGWYISRGARNLPPSAVTNDAASVSAGDSLYGMACASCHGQDGRKPAPIGNSMYPRVPSLSSPAVQEMSDKELFWVIKNGIRFSGMPGFARLDTDPEIWQITYFVRSLGTAAKH